jgi:glycosyltransferase involved in cell wall biosynthesis
MNAKKSVIAIIFSSSFPTGAERRFFALAEALESHGQPTVILLEELKAKSLQVHFGTCIPQIKTYKLPWWVCIWRMGTKRFALLHSFFCFSFFYRVSRIFFWRQVLKKLNIGLVHMAMSSELSNLITCPVVFEVTSPDWADIIIKNPKIVPEQILLHAVSQSVYNSLISALPHRNIICAPIPFPSINIQEMPPPLMYEKRNVIIFAHRFIQRKNGVVFAKSVKRFLEHNVHWRVCFRGAGPQESIIREILKKEIITGKVDVGFVSDLSHELKRSKIFVSVIEPDNYPSQSVIEAMAYGNALLLSDCGQTKDKFHGSNGVLVQPDETSILEGLCSISNNDDGLRNMGLASYHLVRSRFSQEAYLDHLKKVYLAAGFTHS